MLVDDGEPIFRRSNDERNSTADVWRAGGNHRATQNAASGQVVGGNPSGTNRRAQESRRGKRTSSTRGMGTWDCGSLRPGNGDAMTMGSITSRAAAPTPVKLPALPALGEPSRYVHIVLPACPACGATGKKTLATLRSRSEPDGSTIRRTRCRVCAWVFDVIAEPMTFPE